MVVGDVMYHKAVVSHYPVSLLFQNSKVDTRPREFDRIYARHHEYQEWNFACRVVRDPADPHLEIG